MDREGEGGAGGVGDASRMPATNKEKCYQPITLRVKQ